MQVHGRDKTIRGGIRRLVSSGKLGRWETPEGSRGGAEGAEFRTTDYTDFTDGYLAHEAWLEGHKRHKRNRKWNSDFVLFAPFVAILSGPIRLTPIREIRVIRGSKLRALGGLPLLVLLPIELVLVDPAVVVGVAQAGGGVLVEDDRGARVHLQGRAGADR